jgi:hypothetical protein
VNRDQGEYGRGHDYAKLRPSMVHGGILQTVDESPIGSLQVDPEGKLWHATSPWLDRPPRAR